MANYNFDKINDEVPIEAVLEMHGIYPDSKGWYKIRPDEKEPSAHIDKKRRYGNTVRDFGLSNTFNPITLTMYLNGLDFKKDEDWVKASQMLGEYFGVEPEISAKDKPMDLVSDYEWKELLIYPVARNNMMFFPEKYGHDKTRAYAEKYNIPMSELKKADINMYENIVFSKGFTRVQDLRNNYFSSLQSWYNICRELNIEVVQDKLKGDEELLQNLKDLIVAEQILEKALLGTTKKFKASYYDIERDLQKVINGEVALEIGKVRSDEVDRIASRNKATVFNCKPISLEDYFKLTENGLDNIEYAAIRKGNRVVLSFVSTDSSRINFLIQALKGKERNLAEILVSSALEFQNELQEDVVIGSDDNKSTPTGNKSAAEQSPTVLNNKDALDIG